ncbi:hypothetical protein PDJAM_G00012100, partial [Pangasius djambal]|nr:hypothetical protein [Pangasius djambal]
MTSKMSVSGEQDTKNDKSLTQGKNSDSPEPSCVSMKSEESIDPPPVFRDRNTTTKFSLIQGKRSDSPEPSSVSMRSDESIDPPPLFRDRKRSTDLRSQIRTKKSKRICTDELETVFMVCVCVCVCVCV